MLKNIAAFATGFTLLVSPLVASAQSMGDLQAQIQALLAKINALQGQSQPASTSPQPDDYGTGNPNTGVYCPQLAITLQKGSRDATTGGQVSELQTFLTDYYNLDENIVVGGYFGNLTQRYVVQFQREQDLPTLGIVGMLTRAKIAGVCGGGSVPGGAPVISLSANPYSVQAGGTTMVKWSTQNATRCWMHHGAEGGPDTEEIIALNGTKQFNPYVRYHVKVGCANEPGDGRDGPQSVRDVVIDIISAPQYGQHGSSVWTSKDTYMVGEQVPVSVKATRTEGQDYGPATPGEGYRVLVTVSYPEGAFITNFNPVYNPNNGYWEGPYTASLSGGSHVIKAELFCTSFSSTCAKYVQSKLNLDTVLASAKKTISVNGTTTPSGITVTAPNGGEQWEAGVLNTVTWTPYQYGPDINPSKDVTAYLERKSDACDYKYGCFDNLGKVQESGRASIHWITGQLDSLNGPVANAVAGSGYYIRVVNNVTGAWDRSDGPFMILPKPIRITVNGSATPVAINDVNQPISLTWVTNPGVAGCQLSGIKEVSFSTIQPSIGSATGHIEYQMYPGGISYGVRLQCVKIVNGVPTQISENAPFYVNYIPSPALLQITSPNGGESFAATDSTQVKIAWRMDGISAPPLSIALYKDDKWLFWIAKDIGMDKSFDQTYSYVWAPNAKGPALPTLTPGVNPGYKIYITGQKADGSGYVDDKSDASFSFVSSTPTPLLDIRADGSNGPVNVAYGNSVMISWTSLGMDSCALTGSGGAVPVGLNGSSNAGTGTGQIIWGLKCKAGANTYTDSVTVNFAPAPIPTASKVTPTCTYGSSTINIEGGSEACRSWCLSLKAEAGDKAAPPGTSANSCVFKDSNGVSTVVASASTANANLANALTALEAALKAMLAKLGQ